MTNLQDELFFIDTSGESPEGKDFTVSKSKSTVELDKILYLFSNGRPYLLTAYCKLLKIDLPTTEEEVLGIVISAEMIKLGWWINRDILKKFPDEKPEYYDFTETKKDKNQFCTDNGRLLWTLEIDKGDLIVTCESRNKYRDVK